MQFPQNGKKAGLYLRLSRDELVGRESNSISNQRMILTEYAQKNGFVIVDEYADDGVSGTTFERPSFQRMMDDIKGGKIDTVIVKDLSRLGRDYLGTGEHIENIFPKLGVRFISIYESYDSFIDSESADFLPYINLCNERHAKQSGRKSKDTKDHMAAMGEFIGSKAPFGYVLDPDDKHHLLIDPEAADSVRLIFNYACNGLGYKAIARRLLSAASSIPRLTTTSNSQPIIKVNTGVSPTTGTNRRSKRFSPIRPISAKLSAADGASPLSAPRRSWQCRRKLGL